MEKALVLPRFDLTLSPRGSGLLQTLLGQLFTWYPHRSPPAPFREKLARTLDMLVANLASISLSESPLRLIVVGRPEWYQKNLPLIGESFTHATIRVALRFLTEKGYADRFTGRSSRTQSFRRPGSIKPTQLFADLVGTSKLTAIDLAARGGRELRLKSAWNRKGARTHLPFNETTETKRMRANVERINSTLLLSWPDLEITRSQQTGLERKLRDTAARDDTASPFLDLTRRTLYRVFNNGTFDDGGRFYGGWWQNIPTAYRPYITINGERTVEIDFSAMHPTILYAELGIPMPADAYDIGFGERKVVKRTFNALINAKSTGINPVEGFDEQAFGMTWSEFLKRLKANYAPFKRYFGTRYGLKLQRMDSDIAEEVLLHFADRGEAVLPIHDSFVCRASIAGEVEHIMRLRFKEFVQVKSSVRTDRLSMVDELRIERTIERKETLLLSRGFEGDAARFPHTGPYGEYNRRQQAWIDRIYRVE